MNALHLASSDSIDCKYLENEGKKTWNGATPTNYLVVTGWSVIYDFHTYVLPEKCPFYKFLTSDLVLIGQQTL